MVYVNKDSLSLSQALVVVLLMLRFFFLVFFYDGVYLQQENTLIFLLIFGSLYIAAPPAGLIPTSILVFLF